jgi:hypothetical protein
MTMTALQAIDVEKLKRPHYIIWPVNDAFRSEEISYNVDEYW